MTTIGRKKLIWACNILLVLALVGAGVYAMLPLAQAPPPAKVGPFAAGGNTAGPQAVPPLTAYSAILQRNLRQPLEDKPVTAGPAIDAPPPTSLRLVLLGTVVEPENSYAIFSLPNGTMRTVAVGETIDGAELIAVTSNSATVKHMGRPVLLRVQKEGKT